MKQSNYSTLTLGSSEPRLSSDAHLPTRQRLHNVRLAIVVARAREILNTVQGSTGIAEFGDAEDFLKTLNCACCNDGEESAFFVRQVF